jgi:hypothetical protein
MKTGMDRCKRVHFRAFLLGFLVATSLSYNKQSNYPIVQGHLRGQTGSGYFPSSANTLNRAPYTELDPTP